MLLHINKWMSIRLIVRIIKVYTTSLEQQCTVSGITLSQAFLIHRIAIKTFTDFTILEVPRSLPLICDRT